MDGRAGHSRQCQSRNTGWLAENANVYVPAIESPEYIDAARKATREENDPS